MVFDSLSYITNICNRVYEDTKFCMTACAIACHPMVLDEPVLYNGVLQYTWMHCSPVQDSAFQCIMF